MKKHKEFADKISQWGISNDREMPWKGEKNPYLIWLSEIILQQTRVAQGMSYFLAFKKRFPSVLDLAKAEEKDVLKLWEGLGYYSRARNLHFTAKYIANEKKGVFPKTFDELVKLKGVGAYTAAAIASFAYNTPKAVVDGNVIRVLSRYFGIETFFDTALEKRKLQAFADSIIQSQEPAVYNQAIMDFGAEICTPKQVDCSLCFLSETCFAFKTNKQELLPLRKPKAKLKERFFSFLILKIEDKTYIEQRKNNDIWKGLFQFPLLETKEELLNKTKDLNQAIAKEIETTAFEIETISKKHTQKLSHQKLSVNFIEIGLSKPLKARFIEVKHKKLSNFAFPKIINVYLANKLETKNDK